MQVIKNEKKLDSYIDKINLKEVLNTQNYDIYRKNMELVCFKKNEEIYRNKDHIESMLFLVKGRIKVSSNMSNGKSQLINFYKRGGLLGDLEFFGLSNPYTSITVPDEAWCISLRLKDTKILLSEDAKFLLYIGNILAEKLKKSSSNNAINMFYSLENRLCSYIQSTSVKVKINDDIYSYYTERLGETSETLGSSYRHLQRVMKSLSEKGVIQKYKKGYIVTDEKQLKDLALDVYI